MIEPISTDNMKSYDSVLVAKYMLALAWKKGIVLNVTKVQKMLYILYGYFVANHDHPVLTEQPKAWPYGPVFPRSQKKVDYSTILPLEHSDFNEIKNDSLLTDKLNLIIDKYSKFTASQLSGWSHEEGGPWALTCQKVGFNWNAAITDDLIKSYFQSVSVL